MTISGLCQVNLSPAAQGLVTLRDLHTEAAYWPVTSMMSSLSSMRLPPLPLLLLSLSAARGGALSAGPRRLEEGKRDRKLVPAGPGVAAGRPAGSRELGYMPRAWL